jgi:hypothetical protein
MRTFNFYNALHYGKEKEGKGKVKGKEACKAQGSPLNFSV